MINLYRKRNFSDLINDTFGFLKINGSHYFKHFFIINGGLLLILILLIFLTFKYYLQSLFSNLNNINNLNNSTDAFINNNPLLFISISVIFLFLIAFISLINVSYPIIYMSLYDSNSSTSFQTKDLIRALFKNMGKIIIFFFVIIGISIPILILYFLSLQLNALFLLLLPIYFITIPIFITVIYQAFFQYLINREKIRTSFSLALETIKLGFWPIVGSTIIIFIIVQVAQTIITIIPTTIYFVNLYVNPGVVEDTNERIGIVTAMISGTFVFMILLNYTLSNLLSINQGMIFYSFHESKNNKSALNEIELIGKNSNED